MIINVCIDFTEAPGARYKTDGNFSGQEFFEDLLEPKFLQIKELNQEKLVIDLDGTDGYATSFLDQSFGQLARKYGYSFTINKLDFISNEDPYLVDEIKAYMGGE